MPRPFFKPASRVIAQRLQNTAALTAIRQALDEYTNARYPNSAFLTARTNATQFDQDIKQLRFSQALSIAYPFQYNTTGGSVDENRQDEMAQPTINAVCDYVKNNEKSAEPQSVETRLLADAYAGLAMIVSQVGRRNNVPTNDPEAAKLHLDSCNQLIEASCTSFWQAISDLNLHAAQYEIREAYFLGRIINRLQSFMSNVRSMFDMTLPEIDADDNTSAAATEISVNS